METFEDPEAFHRNLFCQWAVGRGFDPLVFLKLYANHNKDARRYKQNPECVEHFETFLKNPNVEKVKQFKDVIFPVVNPGIANFKNFECQTENHKKTHFFCTCTGCLLRETKNYDDEF